MNIIKPFVKEIINTTPGKKMEYCGRVCYKSDSSINDSSYIKFLQNIKKSGHTSVLEHERICFEVNINYKIDVANTKYFNITYGENEVYISANIRAWLQNINSKSIFYPFLKEVYPFLFEEECLNEKLPFIRIVDINSEKLKENIKNDIFKYHTSRTFEIHGSRSFSHQAVRHRIFSFSQQSQRYCNFSNDKFGHSIDFIMPIIDDKKEFSFDKKNFIYDMYAKIFKEIEDNYFYLINSGVRPEDARAVLPNAAATVLVMTGTVDDWDSFFKLRCDEHAQREIRDIANLIKGEIYKK